MTIPEVQIATAALADLFTKSVQLFEAQTGTIVHSLPVLPHGSPTGTAVQVKVQIP